MVPGDSVPVVLGGLLEPLDTEGEPVESTGTVAKPSGQDPDLGGEAGLFVEEPRYQVGFEEPDLVGGLHGAGLACRCRGGSEHRCGGDVNVLPGADLGRAWVWAGVSAQSRRSTPASTSTRRLRSGFVDGNDRNV